MSVNRKAYILDTSALIALFEDEKGADRVEALLAHERVFIPFIALLETYYISLQEQGQETADIRHASLAHGEAEVLWNMDEGTVIRAARIKAMHHISRGDSIVAAFAMQQHAVLVHKDPEFEPLANELALEALPYKPGGKP